MSLGAVSDGILLILVVIAIGEPHFNTFDLDLDVIGFDLDQSEAIVLVLAVDELAVGALVVRCANGVEHTTCAADRELMDSLTLIDFFVSAFLLWTILWEDLRPVVTEDVFNFVPEVVPRHRVLEMVLSWRVRVVELVLVTIEENVVLVVPHERKEVLDDGSIIGVPETEHHVVHHACLPDQAFVCLLLGH